MKSGAPIEHHSWREYNASLTVADRARWPTPVPRDYFITPHGFLHPDCVYDMVDGQYTRYDRARNITTVYNADGGVAAENGACTHQAFDFNGKPRGRAATLGGVRPQFVDDNASNGYQFALVETGAWNSDFAVIYGEYVIPGVPPNGGLNNSGRGVQFFYWNGIQGDTDLFQPIIGYNGNSTLFVQATKYQGGYGYYGHYFTVSSGDKLALYIYETSPSTVHDEYLYRWNTSTSSWNYLGGDSFGDVDTYHPTGIYGAVETVFMTECADYPGLVVYGLWDWECRSNMSRLAGCFGWNCSTRYPNMDHSAGAYNEHGCTSGLRQNAVNNWDWMWDSTLTR